VKHFLVIIILLMLFRPVLPVVDYIINHDYIAKELCINRAKPQMHCNGKCQLMKALAKSSENEKPLSGKKSSHTEKEVLFCESFFDFDFEIINIPTSLQYSIAYTNLYCAVSLGAVFRPPLFIS